VPDQQPLPSVLEPTLPWPLVEGATWFVPAVGLLAFGVAPRPVVALPFVVPTDPGPHGRLRLFWPLFVLVPLFAPDPPGVMPGDVGLFGAAPVVPDDKPPVPPVPAPAAPPPGTTTAASATRSLSGAKPNGRCNQRRGERSAQ
jgi:hypothetical protein